MSQFGEFKLPEGLPHGYVQIFYTPRGGGRTRSLTTFIAENMPDVIGAYPFEQRPDIEGPLVVAHLNGNQLDYSILQWVPPWMNSLDRVTATSPYPGVYWEKGVSKWGVRHPRDRKNGRQYRISRHTNELEAARFGWRAYCSSYGRDRMEWAFGPNGVLKKLTIPGVQYDKP